MRCSVKGRHRHFQWNGNAIMLQYSLTYRSSGRITVLLKVVSKFLWIPLNRVHLSVSLCLTQGCVAGKTKPLPRSAYGAYRLECLSPNVLSTFTGLDILFVLVIAKQNVSGDIRNWWHTDFRLCAALLNERVSHAMGMHVTHWMCMWQGLNCDSYQFMGGLGLFWAEYFL